ncbi:probable cytochrome P450 6t1 [Drosophila pseudoobscura]|uniref:Probable cytochrome P450 6t1 n=1 Tax=Drosophila pseudoobscura pseudoobscura TaxID=46245 RepID=A0A6I8UY61_DROPS|nr:probable cytochrome P450 6t1 [Drosophila pseudoobscura]XP_033236932.1 probable cytochrome P450 6t1 [Drosophila pseudoobscura]
MILVIGVLFIAAAVAAIGLLFFVVFPLVCAAGLIIFGIIWLWQRHHFCHWLRLGVPYIRATPFVGNVWKLLRGSCCFGDQFRQLYESKEAAGNAYVGIHVLHNHALLLRDPALIKRILVEDFSQFSSRFETTDPIGDTMGAQNLFFSKHETWRETHKIFAPFFAVSKVRQMYGLLEHIGQQLEEHMEDQLNGKSEIELEVKQLCALFTTDIIASLAFGLEAHSLQKPDAEFRRMCVEVNDPRPKRLLHLFTMFFFPRLSRMVRTHLYSDEYERFMRQSMDFVLAQREKSGEKRHDLIDIFLQLKRTEPPTSIIHRPDFFVAQASFLLLAGFDTSSSTITFALYELAKAPAIQKRLRDELSDALRTNRHQPLNFDSVNGLSYLRQVVDEVLRLYPPTAFLDRCCNDENGYDLSAWNCGRALKLPAGAPVYISVLGLHRDPVHWPNPNQFDPEHFSPEQREQHHPMTYLPFGAGPRGCIGTLLGQLEIKVGLLHILKNFRVELCERTLPEMVFDPKAFVLTAKGGTYLRFVKDTL